jgi:hypothetical protein
MVRVHGSAGSRFVLSCARRGAGARDPDEVGAVGQAVRPRRAGPRRRALGIPPIRVARRDDRGVLGALVGDVREVPAPGPPSGFEAEGSSRTRRSGRV